MNTWHPLIVHFPLALLPLSAAVDLAALLKKRQEWHNFACLLLVLGAVGALVAVLSGNASAADYRNTAAQSPIQAHEDRATLALLLFVGLCLCRLPLHLRGGWQGWGFKLWLAGAAVGCILLWQAGMLGGELVYRYGVGVKSF